MADQNGTKVTIQAGEHELKFIVDIKAHNAYMNEMMPTNKVAPAENFLSRCLVDPAQAELLESICDQGKSLELAQLLVDEFSPEMELKVKKSTR